MFNVHVEFINGCVIIFGLNGLRIGVANFFPAVLANGRFIRCYSIMN